MIGPLDRRPSSGQLVAEVVRGRLPGWTEGLNNFVDVRDVARGTILAHDRGERGRRYILGGVNLTYRQFFETVARVAGVAPPRRHAPRAFAMLLGRAGDLYELVTGREPLLNSVQARYGYTTTFQFSSERANRELGYAAGPIEPAIRDCLAFFREVGILTA
jgi:dihydroflavonol-4-reductase